MRGRNRPVACLCIAIIVFAALVPGLCALDHALAPPQWILLADETPIPFLSPIIRSDEQPAALAGLLSSRAPPRPPLA